MHQPPRAAVDQRQCGRDQRVVGRLETNLLREREPQHHASLRIVWQPLPRGAVDQRVEIGQAAQGLPGDRQRECAIGRRQVARGGECALQRLSTPKHRVQHLQRGLARANALNAWHCHSAMIILVS